MTVQTSINKIQYVGTGTTTAFSVTFPFQQASWLKVIVRATDGTESTKILNTDYTVSGAGNPSGGTVTFTTAPALDTIIDISRTNVPQTQETDYEENDTFPAEAHEAALDKLTYLIQQVYESLNRTLKIPQSDDVDIVTTIANSIVRANTLLGFDEDGNPEPVNYVPGDPTNLFIQAGTSAVSRTYQDKVRERLSPEDFGAVGDGTTNDTIAFQRLSTRLNALGGGVIDLSHGKTYLVGSQTFAGTTGLGYSYLGADIIKIENCTKPVIINGNGAKIKIASGLKYGSFNPTTGASFTPTLPFINNDFRATIGQIIYCDNCESVEINNLEVDGNDSGAVLGGQWGDTGRQLNAYGLFLRTIKKLVVENVYSHHNCLDGILISYPSLTSDLPAKPQTLINVVCEYNGRQGLSWVGGIGLTAINCKFNYTGRGALVSAPGAGVDIEAESSICRRGTFINCEFGANSGVGMVADSGDSANVRFYDCRFYGIYNYAIWPKKNDFVFTNCLIAGGAVNSINATTYENRTKFFNCKFSGDETFNGVAVKFDPALCDFTSQNPVFENCLFVTNNSNVKGPVTSAGSIWKHCTVIQNGSSAQALPRGTFYDGNSITISTGSANMSGSTLYRSVATSGSISGVNRNNFGTFTDSLPPDYITQFNGFGTDGSFLVEPKTIWRHAIPTTGTYARGDTVINTIPTAGGNYGWVCITGGTPGTWKAFGTIAS